MLVSTDLDCLAPELDFELSDGVCVPLLATPAVFDLAAGDGDLKCCSIGAVVSWVNVIFVKLASNFVSIV